jgi:hypothetical protein
MLTAVKTCRRRCSYNESREMDAQTLQDRYQDRPVANLENDVGKPSAAVKTPTWTRVNCRRLAREWKTVKAMIQIYCRDIHGQALCPECLELQNYVEKRLVRCRFGQEKPTCAMCPVHCYQRSQRERIKTVMRYSGARMLREHPWLSLCHLFDGIAFSRFLAVKSRPADYESYGRELPPA